jgi:hypothetical protein
VSRHSGQKAQIATASRAPSFKIAKSVMMTFAFLPALEEVELGNSPLLTHESQHGPELAAFQPFIYRCTPTSRSPGQSFLRPVSRPVVDESPAALSNQTSKRVPRCGSSRGIPSSWRSRRASSLASGHGCSSRFGGVGPACP